MLSIPTQNFTVRHEIPPFSGWALNRRQVRPFHWNGKAWHPPRSPDQLPGEEFLISVTAGADGTAMAVGGFNEEDEAQDFAVYWNGTKWQF